MSNRPPRSQEETRAKAQAFKRKMTRQQAVAEVFESMPLQCARDACKNTEEHYEFYDGLCAECEAERRKHLRITRVLEQKNPTFKRISGAFS